MIGWLCALLGGCDWIATKDLRPGESTIDDIRRLMGPPETVRERANGSMRYEYPRGPQGMQTWMVEIDANGRFVSMSDALAAPNLQRVQPGMSRDQVRELLGRPGDIGRDNRSGQAVLTWKVPDDRGGAEMFHVQFGPDDQVVKIERSADPETVYTR